MRESLDRPYDPRDPRNDGGTTPPTLPGPPRFNTTPNWQDPYNPPSPGDPYWAEWIAANPTYRGQGYTGPVTPPGPGGNNDHGTTHPGTLGGLLAPFVVPAERYGQPAVPVFHAPKFVGPAPFAAPSAADVLNDPGYQFSRDESLHAIEATKAAGGILNTGGTLKDIAAWANNFANTRYGDVYSRSADVYDRNFNSQYLTPYKFAYQSALDEFAPQLTGYTTQSAFAQRQNELDFNHAYDAFRDQRDSSFDKYYKVA